MPLATARLHVHLFACMQRLLLPRAAAPFSRFELLSTKSHKYTTSMAVALQQQQPLMDGQQAGTAEQVTRPGRVLSIQSHVVSGYVGNKCAILPLQLLGFDVDPIMTVQFSNHTGYPSFKGQVHSGEQLTALLDGMAENGLLQHSHMLTGYIGSLSLLEAVVKAVGRLRAACPALTWVCDPVMGDEGRMYVAQDLVDAFRSKAVPLASVLTPNQYEAELLTGRSICSVQDALEAAQMLLSQGPHTVVITSMDCDVSDAGTSQQQHQQQAAAAATTTATAVAAKPELGMAGDSPAGGSIVLVACTLQAQQGGAPSSFTLTVPKINAYFTGTGDLLSALLLAYMDRHQANLAAAVEQAVAALQGVLWATAAVAGEEHLTSGHVRSAAASKARELQLVQNLHHITCPTVINRVVPL